MFIQINIQTTNDHISNEKKFEILNFLKNNGKKILFQTDKGKIQEGLTFDDFYVDTGFGHFRLKNVKIVDFDTFYEIIDIRNGMMVLGDYLGA